MRVLFAGTPAVAVPSLDALVEAGFDVVAVLTRPDAPMGRKRVLTPSPVAARAAELGIDVIHAAKVDADVTAKIAAVGPDVAAIVAYGGLVPPAALDIPRHGWINLHFSLLPAWRGAAPVQRAVMAGDDVTGRGDLPAGSRAWTPGPVFGTLTEAVGPEDTAGATAGTAVPQRRRPAGPDPLRHRRRQGCRRGRRPGDVTLAPKLTLEDGRLDWHQPALAIGRQARGVTPEPGAWTTPGRAAGQAGAGPAAAGRRRTLPRVPLALHGKSVLVGTGSHAVELTRIQPAGKKMMAAADWARGMASLESVVFE